MLRYNPDIVGKSVYFLILMVLTIPNCIGQINFSDKLKSPISELPKANFDSVGIIKDSITNLIQLINSTPPNDFRGLIIIKDNKLVVEEYFNTYWRETIHDIRSGGKSITSLLLGIAIDKGLIKNTDQSVYSFFTNKKYILPAKDGHLDIKIKHLLTMSSGLNADDTSDSPGNTANWLTKKDWVNFTTSLPMIFKPGEKYVYNDICPMLVGALIEEVSGQKLADFANENLFKPLGIKEFYWYTAPNGKTVPMGNLYISTLDFSKIGQLVLNKGKWQNKQIISSSWIKELFQNKMELSKEDPFGNGYSYLWFLGSKEVKGHTVDYIYASGSGGNNLFVVPSQNLVICLISSAYGQGYGAFRSQNIFQFILRSLVFE